METLDVAIIGGGLGGLAVARGLRGSGLRVRVFERGSAPGGRAATRSTEGLLFDRGPHALLRGGAGERALANLGVAIDGARPPLAGLALTDDAAWPLPATPAAVLRFGALRLTDRLRFAGVLLGLGRVDASAWDDRPLRDWLATQPPALTNPLLMFARVATYTHAPDVVSAGYVIRSLVAAQRGVRYLHGGWQALADQLAEGVDVASSARVSRVDGAGGRRRLTLADGRQLGARTVVVAAGPGVARALLGVSWSGTPVHASCLTVGLDALPRPANRFALGLDAPLYYAVASQTARLGAGHVLHVARYLAPGAPAASVAPLERLLDRLQPGWRAHERARQWLPRIVVTHHLPTAATGGPAGRADCQVASDAFVVGDWVGAQGHLVDAALASAAEVVARLRPARAVAA